MSLVSRFFDGYYGIVGGLFGIAATAFDGFFISVYVEGFFYGKIFCALICTLSKEVQSSPGPGLYSGIFAVYLQYSGYPSNNSRTAVIFYSLCILYILSTVTFVADFVQFILGLRVSGNSICKNIIFYQLCRQLYYPYLKIILITQSQSYY